MSEQSRIQQRPNGEPRQRRPRSRQSAPRRTNAERTAETRQKLINATIDCLYRRGYAATTTIVVAEEAKVSRGAMLHHFPTRVDLLLAAAEHILEDQRASRAKALREAEPGAARLYAAADVSWNVQNRPSSVALIEIMMGSRSDAELQKGMAPFVKQMSEWRHEAAERAAERLGVDDVETMHDLIHLHLAALRGLLLELMFTRNVEEIESARNLLTRYERQLGTELIRQAREQKKKKKKTVSNRRTARKQAEKNDAKREPAQRSRARRKPTRKRDRQEG